MSTDGRQPELFAEENGALPAPPRSASARGYLRNGLPGVYQDSDFGLRFIESLEGVLDPIVSMLDTLPAHLDTQLAPDAFLELIGEWLGLLVGENVATDVRRAIVGDAMELTRRRGTAKGLELMLALRFPSLDLAVEDGGYCVVADAAADLPPSTRDHFIVRSRSNLTEDEHAAIIRVIDRERPVHVSFELLQPESIADHVPEGAL